MDTTENIEKIYARQINSLIRLFNSYLLSCQTKEKTKECIDFNWFGLIFPESMDFLESKFIPWPYRIELKWIKNKRYFCLIILRALLKLKVFIKKCIKL